MPVNRRRSRNLLLLLAAALLAGLVTAAHVHVSSQGYDYVGPLLVLDHVFDLAAALTLLAVCIAVGRFALGRCGIVMDGPLEAITFAAGVGAGIVATAILALGAAHGLQAPTLGLLIVALALLARNELRELPGLAARGLSYIGEKSGGRAPLLLGGFGLAAAAVFMIVLALMPPVDWDALMYHLQVPDLFLQHGRIYLPLDNLHVSRVGLIHMLYLPLLAAGSSSGPALLSALLALLLGIAVFSLCARFLSGQTGSLSLLLLWATTTILLVAITPRVDASLAFYLFLAHYALLIALSSSAGRAHFYLAAVLLGFAVGIKYHALPYALGLAPLIVWAARSRAGGFAASLRPLTSFGLLVAAAALPWLLKNWVLLGAPLYPFLADAVLQPWLVPLFGGRLVPPSIDPQIFQWIWQIRLPFNLKDAFLAPEKLTIELEGAFYYLSPALLLLPLWPLFARNRTLNWLVIPAVGYLLILLTAFPLTNLRYLIPAVAPLTIAVVYMAVRSSERFLSAGAARTLLALLAGLALIPSGIAVQAWLWDTAALGHLVGTKSREEYLATHIDPSVRTYAALARFVNAEVAPDSRILMLFEARGYYLTPSVIQDNRATNWPLLAARLGDDDCLEQQGISHVLLGVGSVRYYVHGGLDPEVIRWGAFRRFAGRCLTPVYNGPGFLLFAVKP